MAGENKLSDKKLRSMLGKKRDSQIMLADGKGMSVRVTKNGAVSFVYQFRQSVFAKTTTWLTIGKYPDVSLMMARQKRDKCRTYLADGRDPREALTENEVRKREGVTVKQAIDFWVEQYINKNLKRPEEITLRMNKYILPKVGGVPIETISSMAWADIFDDICDKKPITGKRVFKYVKQAIKYCNMKRIINCDALNNFDARQFGENAEKRDRVLDKSEIKDLWFYSNIELGNEIMTPSVSRMVYLLLVFGARLSEVLLSTWDEWDFERWVWTVPKAHSKNEMEILRPVPTGIRAWLTALKSVTGECSNIIGYDMSQPVASGHGKRIGERLNHKPWRLHDLRRTLATHLADMEVDNYVIEQLLGHKLPGVMGIYNRSHQLSKKLAALELWVGFLDSLLDENMIKMIGRDDLEKMPDIDRIVEDSECKWLTSVARGLRDTMEKDGRFPKRVIISPLRPGWRLSELQAWIKGEWKPE